MNRLISPITDIKTRYANLTRHIQWMAHLTESEANLVIWAYKNRIKANVCGKRVKQFGGCKNLIQQAYRTRNA